MYIDLRSSSLAALGFALLASGIVYAACIKKQLDCLAYVPI